MSVDSRKSFKTTSVMSSKATVFPNKLPLNKGIKAKPGNGTSLLPFIEYNNHCKAMNKVKPSTDTGLYQPQKAAALKTKMIRHELSSIMDKKRKQKRLVTENMKLYSRIC